MQILPHLLSPLLLPVASLLLQGSFLLAATTILTKRFNVWPTHLPRVCAPALLSPLGLANASGIKVHQPELSGGHITPPGKTSLEAVLLPQAPPSADSVGPQQPLAASAEKAQLPQRLPSAQGEGLQPWGSGASRGLPTQASSCSLLEEGGVISGLQRGGSSGPLAAAGYLRE